MKIEVDLLTDFKVINIDDSNPQGIIVEYSVYYKGELFKHKHWIGSHETEELGVLLDGRFSEYSYKYIMGKIMREISKRKNGSVIDRIKSKYGV